MSDGDNVTKQRHLPERLKWTSPKGSELWFLKLDLVVQDYNPSYLRG